MNILAFISLAVLVLYGVGVTLGNVLYDLRDVRQRRASTRKKLPPLTAIIFVQPGHDPQPLVAQLKSERYRHLRVILVAQNSSSEITATRQRYRTNCAFIQYDQSLAATLLPFTRTLRGPVLTLDTTMRLPTDFLRPSVRLLRPHLDCVRFAHVRQRDTRLGTLLHEYIDCLAQHWSKAVSALHVPLHTPLSGTLYTKRAFTAELRQPFFTPRSHFAAHLALIRTPYAHTTAVRRAWRSLRAASLQHAARPSWRTTPLFVLSLLSVVLLVVMLLLFFYLAVWLGQPHLFAGLVVLAAILTVTTIWSSGALNWKGKVRLLLLLPAGLPLVLGGLILLSLLCLCGVVAFAVTRLHIILDEAIHATAQRFWRHHPVAAPTKKPA